MTAADASNPGMDRGNTRPGEEEPTHAPAHEPAAAIIRDDDPAPGPRAPEDPAPDLDDISAGDRPGTSPGE